MESLRSVNTSWCVERTLRGVAKQGEGGVTSRRMGMLLGRIFFASKFFSSASLGHWLPFLSLSRIHATWVLSTSDALEGLNNAFTASVSSRS